jgi:RND family efflux transporter MFP subunit
MTTIATKSEPKAAGESKASRLVVKALLAAVLIGGVGLLLLLLAGIFKAKVPTEEQRPPESAPGDVTLAEVRLVRRPRFETAVGTVRAVHEVGVGSKLLARVLEVRVKAGQVVSRDEVLVRLDDSDLQTRLKQAEAALAGTQAAADRAEVDYARASRLLSTRTISQEEYDKAAAARKTTQAELERAQQAVREAQVLLDYATLRAPIGGIVIDKRVEAGDTVTPGQVLLTLYDPTRMQLVTSVRESLAMRLSVGQKVPARLEALGHACEATVSEIVPEAQAASRSLTVKVTGPCPPGVYSGMFGRIFIPLEGEQIVVVPAAAVARVGQLELVQIAEDGIVRRRAVQLGRKLEQDYEVLAGLHPGERVVLRRLDAGEGRR